MTDDVTARTLTAERSITYRWIAVGITSGIAANAAAWFFWPRFGPIAEPIDRLLLAVQCAAGIGFVALIMMQGLWRLQDAPHAEDPFANAESQRWKINQRVYTNTLEQALIFAPIFAPMFISLGYHPAYTQLLYRLGDSITNCVSPLYPYFPLLLGWIADIDRDKLPEPMQSMAPADRDALVAKTAERRNDLQRQIKDLAGERSGFLEKKRDSIEDVEASLDDQIYTTVREQVEAQGMKLEGPVPADTAFNPLRIASCDAVVAMYHDQGLPVLKHMGFGRAVNITLGLPFIRTSVDHGTALDLAGSGKACTGSLHQAVLAAVNMAIKTKDWYGASGT